MDANIQKMLDQVDRSITRVQAMRAERFNQAWPIGHPDRDAAMRALQDSNPTLLDAISKIEERFGPGIPGCERALSA